MMQIGQTPTRVIRNAAPARVIHRLQQGLPGPGAMTVDSGVYTYPGLNWGITPEGGEAFKLTNRSGADSVKGMAVCLSDDYDDSVVAATEPYIVVGFAYNSGVADGDEMWIVRDGLCDLLLEDGYGAIRNGWVRLSALTAGRVAVQSAPGYERRPSSVAYTKGSAISGALSDLLLDDGTKYVMGEQTGAPGLDVVFTFNVDERMDALRASGYYANNHASGVQAMMWNYATAGWGPNLFTMPANGVDDVAYSVEGLSADYYNAGEMKVRLYHPDAGTAAHRIYLDKLVLAATASGEHFKELGHTTRQVSAGTNVLVRANIHLL